MTQGTITINHIQYEVVCKTSPAGEPENIRNMMIKNGIAYRLVIRKPNGQKLYTVNQYKSGNYSKVC